ncbi:hypothetical protein [Pontibacter sp. G13]|uniref:hypothetical protein n=1 Tax=Pontibacter sp. G13 TaxID=3074898 RepID=UPI00288A9463|nr:hypothetical protein [Pontibacter sp. G13]WNJ15973.1 hypothetical protein RJD25_14010 [Pontibacter sp. G13]
MKTNFQLLRYWLAIFTMGMVSTAFLHAQDCRLDPATLKPVIQRFNPFFSDHRWDGETQMELARMGKDRLLIITQDGCKRHHTTFSLIISPNQVESSADFWITEVESMMQKVYWQQLDYQQMQPDFERIFAQKFRAHGLNNQFNFPIGTRNFVCELGYDEHRGARIRLEMVSFLFKEKVLERDQGVPSEDDDGWSDNRDG